LTHDREAVTGPPCFLSLVVPIYNGATFVDRSLREILGTLEALRRPFEVIAVCDGCSDDTEACVDAVGDSRIRVIAYPINVGKGHAVAQGLSVARGRLVGWLDADLDIEPTVILRAVERFAEEPVDAVIGSKRHPRSSVAYPRVRRVYSWGFQRLVAALFRVNARDTQVGAKLFRREMIDVVAPLLLIKRYAFDLEVLAVGAEFGFDRVAEVPITLDYRFSGTGINWRAVYRMLLDTVAIAYRIHVRHWYVRRFAALQRQRMDHVIQAADVAEPMPEPSASGTT
jgi:glycosyltransferase involved in cell wall biosynthesis